MQVIAKTSDMDRREWLEARTKGIGGSDASVVLGLNKYKTPFELWLEKTGQVVPQEIQNDAAYFGTLLEDLVAKEFEKRSGKKVRKRNVMFQHPHHEFLIANIDRFVVGEKAILECKTASAFLSKEWEGDEIPEAYIVQVQHYLGVLGPEYKKGYFAVLIGGQKFIWKEIERDDELIEMIFAAEIDFWKNHVLTGVPPAMDGSSAAEQYLKERYAEAEQGKSIDLKREYKDKIDEYLSLKETIKELDERVKALENAIKNELKDAETGFVQNYQVSWKSVTSNRVDTKKLKSQFPQVYEQVIKPSSYRKFSIKQIG
ncbi:lambda-exonuclease family protein [Aeribacillus composti]|uniref:YqaJ viral recombinase family nuclease n=1 Tax=Aeribacillus composti TaxID=1868734 RepID=UPI002E23CF17|nr:YqaJ viral recombinase family protein [Aeribacillus composti]